MLAIYPPLTVTVREITDQHIKQYPPLVLTCTYKGVLFNQETKILAVYPNYSVFEVCDIKPFIEVGGFVYIHSSTLERPLRARLIGRDLSQCRIILSDFEVSQEKWQDRLEPRVQPKEPVYLPLRFGRYSLPATLQDIQVHGIGVLCSQFSLELTGFHPGSPIHTSLQIFPCLSLKKLEGSIEYTRPVNKSITRLGIQIYPGQDQLYCLQRYIERRQAEILQELDHLYFQSIGPRRVEELYF